MNIGAVCFSDGCMLTFFELYPEEITSKRAIVRAQRVTG